MAAFTAGNIVVYRVGVAGTGSATLTSAATAVFLDEYTPAGKLVQSIALPTTVAGTNNPLTASGSAGSEGQLSNSADGRYLLLTGYDAAVGTLGIASTTAAADPRVVGRVDASGAVDTSTILTGFSSGNNIRSAASADGTTLYVAGATGIAETTIGSTLAPNVLATTNNRQIEIVNGQLYYATQSGTIGLYTLGSTPAPTTGTQTAAIVPGTGSGANNGNTVGSTPAGFAFAKLSASSTGNDTLYVADASKGIEKFSLVGTTWVSNGFILNATGGGTGDTGLVLSVAANGTVNIYVTDPTNIDSYSDTTGYNGTIAAGATTTTIATASTNTAFRGVAFTPQLPTISLQATSISQNEGNSGTTPYTFTLTRSAGTGTGTATVNYAVTGTGGVDGNDFVGGTLPSGTATFTGSNLTTTVTIPVQGDTIVEADETFTLSLSNPSSGYALGTQASQTGTILNDDVAVPTISITDASIAEGNSGTSLLTFTVTSSAAAPTGGIGFTVTTADGTATAGSDYVALSSVAGMIAAGQTTGTVSVTINGDTTYEADETLTATLGNVTNATIARATATGTILNDDAAPTISISDPSVLEGNSGTTNLNYTVTLSAASGLATTVAYATADGTANQPSDYSATSGTLTFAPGVTSQTVSVLVNGDTTVEPDETVFVNLSGATNATIAKAQGTGTILNDDLPTLSIADASVTEGNSGTKLLIFTVTANAAAPTGGIGFTVTTADGTATAGSDYVALSNVAGTIAAGQTTGTVSVTINGDTTYEADETLTATLGNVTNATIARATATGTILNDDAAPTISISDPSVLEGNSGTTNLNYTVTLSAASGLATTVAYATADGTANQPSDYSATSGTLTFAPGVTSQTVTVLVNGDTTVEPDETVFVNLSGATNATIAKAQGTGTILNDDTAPVSTTPTVDISQVYGGGGNTGAAYTNDFIELYNYGTTAVSLAGWSVQYASATGTTWQVTTLSGSILPGHYYLVQETKGAGGTTSLPTPDATGTIAMATAAGKVALSSSVTPFTGMTPTGSSLVDFVGYGTTANSYEGTGPAPAPSNTTADFRTPSSTDTNNNSTDFTTGAPNPRNAAFGAAAAATVSINSVSITEGNSGTKTLSFTVTRTDTTSAFTIDYATADGTATTADQDYVATSGTLTFAAGGPATQTIGVTIVGDTKVESDETFTVALSNVKNTTGTTQLGTATGTGTIQNDDFNLTPTYTIQGSGFTSPLVGQKLTTSGIVTAVSSTGYYLQDPTGDGNSATSDAIFVFTSTAPTVAVGDFVDVSGTVQEYKASTANGAFSTTELSTITATVVLSHGNALPAAVIIGPDGILPPTSSLAAGDAFYESLEGMRVTVQSPVSVGPTNAYGEIFTVANNGVGATGLNSRGEILETTGATASFGNTDSNDGDFNPERIKIDSQLVSGAVPSVNTGTHFGDVTGILNYDFDNFGVSATSAVTVTQASTLTPTVGTLKGDASHLTVGSYNIENFSSTANIAGQGPAKVQAIATQIITNLGSPDIVALQEVQDNSGPTDDGTVSASTNLQNLVAGINALGGAQYAYIDNPFIGNDTNGGEPGGNIRTAFLYRIDVPGLSFVAGSLATLSSNGTVIADQGTAAKDAAANMDQQTDLASNPFYSSRPPLSAQFLFNGQTVTVVDNHFTSKGGSGDLEGSIQPSFDGGEVQRAGQAQAVNNYVDSLLAVNPNANIIVTGDLNEFTGEEPIGILEGTASISNYNVAGTDPISATATYTPGGTAVLTDLESTLPADQQFDYNFEGNAESLVHTLVSGALVSGAQFQPIHINSDYANQTSDHDPLIASFVIQATPTTLSLTATSDSGSSSTDGITNVKTPTLSGTASLGSTITLYDTDGVTVLGSTTASTTTGSFSITSSALADGQHSLTAVSGTSKSSTVPVTIDTMAPTIALTSKGGLVNQATQTVSGTIDLADAGSLVSIFEDGGTAAVATAVVGLNGVFTTTVALGADGMHSLTASDTDTAGNTGTANLAYTLDTTAPTVAFTSKGGLVNQATQTVSGMVDVADAGTTISIFEDGAATAVATAIVAANGVFSASVMLGADGTHSLTATDSDAAGNVGTTFSALAYTLDTTAPTVAFTGKGGPVNVAVQTVSGTVDLADAGTTVSIFEDGGTIAVATAIVASNGVFSASVKLGADGTHTLTAADTDAAGNTGTAPTALTYTVDTMAPTLAFTSRGGATNQAAQIVDGMVDVADAGSTVSIFEDGAATAIATAAANGYFSASVALGANGTHTLTASDTDAAGNKGVAAPLSYTLNTAAPTFTAGNLVISISGDGDGSGTYTDNQATPLVLQQITTSGAYVSQIVLPQTTTTNVAGTTESVISVEYGSSSEGILQLSADGHSLVIAGYGINAQTYNAGGAAVYGDARLAQSTSVAGGAYTPVTRVIADIDANGTIDTSTALLNVDNKNNPRSVTTVDGSSFYMSGQGVKGDTTQGLFYVKDGAATATGIDQSTDTRIATIYNGQLYVSRDSTQGTGGTDNIAVYGATLPTTATSATILTGISKSVTLTTATANTANTASIGSSVNLDPENFFFANSTTLYVADGGVPKQNGAGDGGLQKWTLSGGVWTLQYTLSQGLGIVAGGASATAGTTGLIGLTGTVVGNSVQLYATNQTAGDLDQKYVFGITDQLTSTTGAGESFTTLVTAAPDTNIRGIAFAPTPITPTIALAHDTGSSSTDLITSNPALAVTKAVAADTLVYDLDAATTYSAAAPVFATNGSADGTHSVSVEEKDASGNVGPARSLTFTLDTTAPTVTASASKATVEATSVSGAAETFVGSATDSVDGTDVVTYAEQVGSTLTPVTSGQVFALGTHTIVASATDKAGNTGMATPFSFSVVDTTAPTVTASATKATVEATSASGAAETFAGSATDIVDGTDVVTYAEKLGSTLTPVTSGQVFALGTHTIVASATDKAGNVGTATPFSFSVVDTTAPTVTASATKATVEATSMSGAAETFVGSATDTVDGTDVVTYAEQVGSTLTPVTSGQVFGLGTHTIVASSTNKSGSVGMATPFSFSVVDTTAPTVTAWASKATVEATSASGAAETFVGSATDIVDGTDVVTYAEQVGSTLTPVTSGQVFDLGTHTIVASATDMAGNVGMATPFSFTVVDTTAPTVTASAGKATVEATSASGAAETFTGSATDIVDGTDVVTYAEQLASGGTRVVHSGDTFALGTHTIVASATDKAGNTGMATPFSFSIVDTTAPAVTASAGKATVEATSASGASETFVSSATDTVDGTDVVRYAEQVGSTLTPVTSGQVFALGTHTIVASATDKAGNTGMATPFSFSVVDTTAPAVTASAGKATVEATSPSGAAETFVGSATDTVDGTDVVTYAEKVGSTLTAVTLGQVFGLGTHTIVASATDKAGNVGTATPFSFSVVDTTAPTVTASATKATVEATSVSGAAETFTGSATDIVDGTDVVTYAEQVAGGGAKVVHSGDTFALGTHTIVASATDKAGNVGTATPFSFTVVDTTAPAVTASAGKATVEATSASGASETFVSSATDTVDGTVAVVYTEQLAGGITKVVHSGDTFAIGTHTIIASAIDAHGNIGTAPSFSFSVTAPTGSSGVAEDGYIAGATVFADANGNGKLDAGEVSTTTDAKGNFTLVGGSGPLVLTGGTDITTGLALTGTLQAPAGASVVSPLTTIVQIVATTQGISAAAANASVTASLGLPTGTSLTTLDAQTGAMAGNATATAVFAAQTQVANAFSLITGAGGNLTSTSAQTAIASAFTSTTTVLTNATALSALATSAGVTSADASAVGAIGSASNALIATTVASGTSAASTVATIAAAATVAQGAATTSLMQAVANPSLLAATTAAYTGNNLVQATTQAGGTLTAPSVTLSGAGGTISIVDPTLTGTVDLADASGTVQIYANGTAVGAPLAVSAQGTFSTTLALPADGVYAITAAKANASGTVGTSNAVSLTLNSTANQSLFGALTHDVTTAGGNIYALYETILGRAPDAIGLENWVTALGAGTPLSTIAQGFLSSGEYAADYGSSTQSNDAFINQLYQDGLHRQADAGGLKTWENALATGTSRAQVAIDIATSQESQQDLAATFQTGVFVPDATDSAVARLYYGVLGRAPDAAGLQTFETAVHSGLSPTQAAQSFLGSSEYQGTAVGQSNLNYIQGLYQTALGRTGEPGAVQNYETALDTGTATRATVANAFLGSSEFQKDEAGQTNSAYVNTVYQAALGRQADPTGLQTWDALLAGGTSRVTVAQDIVGSAEFASTVTNPSQASFINALYEGALGRPAEAGGLQANENAIAGGASLASIVLGVTQSAEAVGHLAPAVEAGFHVA